MAVVSKIEYGLNKATSAYARQGYIEAKMRAIADLDDANRRVLYHLAFTEGPQYRMGSLLITGMTENELRKMEEKWKLKPGDVYDASYPVSFHEELIRQKRTKLSSLSTKPDQTKQTVDVVFTF